MKTPFVGVWSTVNRTRVSGKPNASFPKYKKTSAVSCVNRLEKMYRDTLVGFHRPRLRACVIQMSRDSLRSAHLGIETKAEMDFVKYLKKDVKGA